MPGILLPRERELWVGEFKFSNRILKFFYGTASAPEAQSKILWINVFSNPLGRYFRLEIDVPERDVCHIEVMDVMGRRLATSSGKQGVARLVCP